MKKTIDYPALEFFKESEFYSPDMLEDGNHMQMHFIQRLHKARVIADIPFIINSGHRSPTHNKIVGGLDDSSHLYGEASDIKYTNSQECFIIVSALIQAGFTRIGIKKGMIHVDDDYRKPKNVLWLYDN
jgi:zinc D-Ala-D-Ala carboxypeptidase